MTRQIVVITVMVGLLLSALPAQAGPLREAATLRAATAAGELQAESSPQRRRSVGRTVGGIFLMAVGTPIMLYSLGRDDVGGEGLAKYFCRSTSTILAGSDGCSFDDAPFGGRCCGF